MFHCEEKGRVSSSEHWSMRVWRIRKCAVMKKAKWDQPLHYENDQSSSDRKPWVKSSAVAIHASSEALKGSWPRGMLGYLFTSHIAVCSITAAVTPGYYQSLQLGEACTFVQYWIIKCESHQLLVFPNLLTRTLALLVELHNTRLLLEKSEKVVKHLWVRDFYNIITCKLCIDKSIFKVSQNRYINLNLSYCGLQNAPCWAKRC